MITVDTLICVLIIDNASVHYYSYTFDMLLRASKSQAHLSASYMLLGRKESSLFHPSQDLPQDLYLFIEYFSYCIYVYTLYKYSRMYIYSCVVVEVLYILLWRMSVSFHRSLLILSFHYCDSIFCFTSSSIVCSIACKQFFFGKIHLT